MAMDDNETIRTRVPDPDAANERVTYEKAIWGQRFCAAMGLVVFAIGAALWLLLQTDWLPENVAKLVEGPKDQLGRGYYWLGLAVMGTGVAGMSYLDLRALQVGSERARKQAI